VGSGAVRADQKAYREKEKGFRTGGRERRKINARGNCVLEYGGSQVREKGLAEATSQGEKAGIVYIVRRMRSGVLVAECRVAGAVIILACGKDRFVP